MKRGDKGFVYHEKGIQLYVEIMEVNDKSIIMDVINGGYTMQIDFVKVPAKVAGNYNEAIGWYGDKMKKEAKKKAKEREAFYKSRPEDNEIPF